MIDNFDSFTYNLVQYFNQLDLEVVVKRNNEISLSAIKSIAPEHIVISPGPGSPSQAGISLAVVEQFAGSIPMLGVCLGHQVIAQVYGAIITRAKQIMHGKTSAVYHQQRGVFNNLNNPLTVTRYHSLVVNKHSLPDCLEATAWTLDSQGDINEIMGISHKQFNLHGVQFHPEAILTEQGHQLLANFING